MSTEAHYRLAHTRFAGDADGLQAILARAHDQRLGLYAFAVLVNHHCMPPSLRRNLL